MTTFTDFNEITELQMNIMLCIQKWVHDKKTPIPLTVIIAHMEQNNIKNFTTIKAIGSLLKKGYIRRGNVISNKTFFVQLRTV